MVLDAERGPVKEPQPLHHAVVEVDVADLGAPERRLERPAFSVQYHPEAAPGPHDAAGEFDAFCALMDRAR